MDTFLEASLLSKAVLSVAAVLGLTFIAERASTRIAGLLAGAPLGVVLIYFFVGYDMGTDYAVESVPYGIASFSATLIFVFAYFIASSKLAWSGPVVTAVIATGAFAATGAVLAEIEFSLPGAVVLTAITVISVMHLFRRINIPVMPHPARITALMLVLRGGSAAFLIVGVIGLAETLGPRWAGLLAGFPVTLLPTLLIIHVTYGPDRTHALIRNFPLGVVSVVLYIGSVAAFFPTLGVIGGSLACLAISSAYLTVMLLWSKAGLVAPTR